MPGMQQPLAPSSRHRPGTTRIFRLSHWLLSVLFGGAVAAVAASSSLDDVKEDLRALTVVGRVRPTAMGPFDVGSLTTPVETGFGKLTLPVSLYYPCDWSHPTSALRLAGMLEAIGHPTRARTHPGAPFARSSAAFPLLLYFPSWFSHRHENSFTLANLASQGFVVASIDDVARLPRFQGRDGEVQQAGLDASSEGSFSTSRALAGRRTAMEARVGSAVLDHIAGFADWRGRIDVDRVGAIGFSFGGSVATTMSLSDPRIRAVVNLDGSLFGKVAETGVDVPLLTLFAGDSFPTVRDLIQPDLGARLEALLDRDAIDQQLSQDTRPDHWTFVVDRTTHLDFSDRLIMPAFADHRDISDLDRIRVWFGINASLSNFLDIVLRDKPKDLFPDQTRAEGLRTLEAASRDLAVRTPDLYP